MTDKVDLPPAREVCPTTTRRLKATYFLMYQGYTEVANMDGGLFKWASKGFPILGVRDTTDSGTGAAGCC